MKPFCSIVSIAIALLLISPATAEIVTGLEWQDGPQDPLTPNSDPVHELGLAPPFPVNEWIEASSGFTELTSCSDGKDDPRIPNVLVEMTNMTTTDWVHLHYVADPGTVISNFDGFVNGQPAFNIDNGAAQINNPLVFESMASDLVFQAGETWKFILQDYRDTAGFLPTAFTSLAAVGSLSAGIFSTGSIIAEQVPEPGTLVLLASGGLILALFARRRKKRSSEERSEKL